jgi:serine/threonine-protein kinase RsbT
VDHHHVHAILLKYLPGTLAETTLDRVLGECGLTRHTFGRRHLTLVIAKLETSIRLFVDVADQQKLKDELSSFGGRSTARVLSVAITEEADVSRARLLMRRVCNDFEVSSVVAQKCVTIVSELARNIVSYTDGGSLDLEVAEVGRRVSIRARDKGRGIPNLEEILRGTYQSKTGLGKGLLGVKRLSKAFDVRTGPGGTDVRVEVEW